LRICTPRSLGIDWDALGLRHQKAGIEHEKKRRRKSACVSL